MRLFLAVAVLMLALVAFTEAQDAETIEQKFERVRLQLAEAGQKVAEGTTNAFDKLRNSDFVVNSGAKLTDFFERVKAGATDLFN